jgi:type I site-specific restriction endonuclease
MSEKTIGVGDIIKGFNEKLQKEREEIKRLRFHLKDVVDELATHLGDYENEMYDWIRKMHELYGSD